MPQSRMKELTLYLNKLEEKLHKPLIILETGCIRNLDNPIGDGFSTEHICRWIQNSKYPKKHTYTSIDLDISVCKKYLQEQKLLKYVSLIEGDSLAHLELWNRYIDFVLLDSKNDAEHIFKEFYLVKNWFLPHTTLAIDDAKTNEYPWQKGKKVIPWLEERRYQIEWVGDRIAVISRWMQ